jgi:transposase-like protein
MDVDGGETLSMGVYPLRNFPAMEPFVSDVLRYCNKKPMFVVDGATMADENPRRAWAKIQRRVLSAIEAP